MSLTQCNIHCMFHNVSRTVQNYLPVSVSLTHFHWSPTSCFTVPHSSRLPATSFKISLLQLNTHCQFYDAPHSVQYTMPVFKMSLTQINTACQLCKSLIQFSAPCKFCNVPHSVQHFLPVLWSSSYSLKVCIHLNTLALLAVFRFDVKLNVL